MSVKRVEIVLLDDSWPRIKMIVNRDGRVRTEVSHWDVALSNFEPAAKDSLRLAVEELIKQRKGQTTVR